jgi:hypothetical protein
MAGVFVCECFWRSGTAVLVICVLAAEAVKALGFLLFASGDQLKHVMIGWNLLRRIWRFTLSHFP